MRKADNSPTTTYTFDQQEKKQVITSTKDGEHQHSLKGTRLTIVFATTSGTSKKWANQLAKFAATFDINCSIKDMGDSTFDFEELTKKDSLVVFIVHSTGMGKPPSSSSRFNKWLTKQGHSFQFLENLRYAIIGKGDSFYKSYQAYPNHLNKLLQSLGATEAIPLVQCDDSNGAESTFDVWTKQDFLSLFSKNNIKVPETRDDDDYFRDNLLIELSKGKKSKLLQNNKSKSQLKLELDVADLNLNQFSHEETTILSNSELVRADPKNYQNEIREIEMTWNGVKKYRNGDYLGIYPKNDPDTVNMIAKYFGMNSESKLNRIMKVRSKKEDVKTPTIGSINEEFRQKGIKHHKRKSAKKNHPANEMDEEMNIADNDIAPEILEKINGFSLTQFFKRIDINSFNPKQLKTLARYSATNDGVRALISLSKHVYLRETLVKSHLNLIELLQIHNVELPFSVFVQLVPLLKPRLYSIANFPISQKKKKKY